MTTQLNNRLEVLRANDKVVVALMAENGVEARVSLSVTEALSLEFQIGRIATEIVRDEIADKRKPRPCISAGAFNSSDSASGGGEASRIR